MAQRDKILTLITRHVSKHPRIVLGVLLVVTVALGARSRPSPSAGCGDGGRQSPRVYNVGTLQKLRRLAKALRSVLGVDSVVSPPDVELVRGSEHSMEIEPVVTTLLLDSGGGGPLQLPISNESYRARPHPAAPSHPCLASYPANP